MKTHDGVGGCLVCLVGLKEDFNAVKPLKDELVAGVELDAWLAVDAVGAKLDAETAFGFVAVAAGLSGATNLTLVDVSINTQYCAEFNCNSQLWLLAVLGSRCLHLCSSSSVG